MADETFTARIEVEGLAEVGQDFRGVAEESGNLGESIDELKGDFDKMKERMEFATAGLRKLAEIAEAVTGAILEQAEAVQGVTNDLRTVQGQIRRVQTGYASMRAETVRVIATSANLAESMNTLHDEIYGVAEAADSLDGAPLTSAQRFAVQLSAEFTEMTDRISAGLLAIRMLSDESERTAENNERLERLMRPVSERITEEITNVALVEERAAARLSAAADLTVQTKRKLEMEARREGAGPGADNSDKDRQIDIAAKLADEEARQFALIEAEVGATLQALQAQQRITEEKARTRAQVEMQLGIENKILEAQQAQREEERRITKEIARKNDLDLETQEQQAEGVQRTRDAFDALASIGEEITARQRESNEQLGKSIASAIDAWLKGFAKQEAFKGVAAFAEGVGSVVMNQANAAAKFQEAAIHFAIAAAAGGAAAAIPGGGGGASRPTNESGDGGGNSERGGGNITIMFNAPVARDEQGRMVARADRESRRRFG
ncbi:MAG: hypothetical protein GY944_29610 [bacterium]|nr:hypothetical protein [bacterium]